ncbi:PaaI family thioesterase [Sphingobium sp. 3R8]|uniref:PaaI family thioesterase n=1 Tax=Sphingobium sp. 3R8 TaxID=2874921 RepID=UPI001CCD948F|nr:PaaI family thioesterase [Sphingobium sp. 3R8]MBZ9650086.1 PaaI family thioesterase [Sphingobium sp. 3R8]
MSDVIDDRRIEERAAQHGLTSRVECAQAIRSLLDNFSCSMADDAQLDEAAARIRMVSELLAGQPSRPAHVRFIEGMLTGLGELSELGPFTGRLHPLPPPFKLVLNGDRAEAYATYSHPHQGPPGLLQGGFIAATFDELLGIVQAGVLRMTVDLQIAYRAPTPLYKELRYTTWLDRIDGRKAYAKGTLHDGDRLCAEASGVFVEPRQRPF